MNDQAAFESWCIVDLMGHTRLAGEVREQTIAGQPFLRIDVPEDGDQPARTLYQSPGSVYSIQPCSEELARLVARSHRPPEINRWELPLEFQKLLTEPRAPYARVADEDPYDDEPIDDRDEDDDDDQ